MRVFLIGFMCSGKSTVGRHLAPLLGLPFMDLDRVVERHVGPLLPFVQQHGEAAFRVQEARVLNELVIGGPAVIATGGGTACQEGHLRRMAMAGTVVWLDVALPELMRRIRRAGGDRPLLHGLKDEALEKRVKELLAEREVYYAGAHHRMNADDAPELVARQIAERLALQAR